MNLPLFNESTGFTILIVYGLVAFALTYWYSRGYADNKTSFLVARRELGTFQGSLSVAAAWLWAPGLFISTQQAYVNGLVGHFWFCLGNFLTLGLFAYFAHRLREQFPEGFTFSGFIKEKFSHFKDWDFKKARHLLERAGFGGTPNDIENKILASKLA